MERVLQANEETALNPDPFDPVEPEFVAGAVVGLGTMRQGSDAAPAVPMSVPVRPAAERKRGSSFRPGCRCVDIGVQVGFQTPKGSAPRARRKGSRALSRYLASRPDRVDAFVDRHFSFAGTLRLHRRTTGWDLLRVPPTGSIGRRSASPFWAASPRVVSRERKGGATYGVQAGDGNACLEWLPIAFPFAEGPRVRIRLPPADSPSPRRGTDRCCHQLRASNRPAKT
jgi:hypothetical protein